MDSTRTQKSSAVAATIILINNCGAINVPRAQNDQAKCTARRFSETRLDRYVHSHSAALGSRAFAAAAAAGSCKIKYHRKTFECLASVLP
jgi:hypothetical protein